MVVFNELRITNNGETLLVDCKIKELAVYSNMYIKSVDVYHYKNVDANGDPKLIGKVLTIYDNELDDTAVKNVRICYTYNQPAAQLLGLTHYFRDEILVVKVTCEGTLGADIVNYPCGMDVPVDRGLAVDWYSMYHRGMRQLNQISDCKGGCGASGNMEQFIITWFSLKLAIQNCDFESIVVLWDRFLRLKGRGFSVRRGGCGCGGN